MRKTRNIQRKKTLEGWKIVNTEVFGNRVSDYYVRNIYIEVFLQIALLWILVPSRLPHQNISKVVQKYIQ